VKDKKYPYIVVERRAVEKDCVEEFTNAKSSFQRVDHQAGEDLSHEISVSEAVYVKRIPWEDGCRVLCVSEGREKKEISMDALKEERFLQDLTALETSVGKGNVKLVEKGRRTGRTFKRKVSFHCASL